MDFFSKCQNKSEAKDLYRKLSKLFHPDHGGDTSLQVELQNQYDRWDSPNNKATINSGGSSSAYESVYNFNPRVEQLEHEIRRLKRLLEDSPFEINRLNNYINAHKKTIEAQKAILNEKDEEIVNLKLELKRYDKQFAELSSGLQDWISKHSALENINSDLKKQLNAQEMPDPSLWGKIKYVMGKKPKKNYN